MVTDSYLVKHNGHFLHHYFVTKKPIILEHPLKRWKWGMLLKSTSQSTCGNPDKTFDKHFLKLLLLNIVNNYFHISYSFLILQSCTLIKKCICFENTLRRVLSHILQLLSCNVTTLWPSKIHCYIPKGSQKTPESGRKVIITLID